MNHNLGVNFRVFLSDNYEQNISFSYIDSETELTLIFTTEI